MGAWGPGGHGGLEGDMGLEALGAWGPDALGALGTGALRAWGAWGPGGLGACGLGACTMYDLNHDVWECAPSVIKPQQSGWVSPSVQVPFHCIAEGLLHVDDMAIFSKIWYKRCIAQNAK